MKVLCDREKLREGLAVANNVIPSKSTKPVLQSVCFVATEDALELVGTDLEVAVRYRIDDVKVERTGVAVVPARVAFDFVRDLSGEAVELAVSDGNCTITSGSDSCELVTADPDDFPEVARFDPKGAISIQAGTFTRLVGRTAFAAAREPGRYAMHGVLTEFGNGELKMVATDGRRLAVASAAIDTPDPKGTKGGKGSDPVIVPTKGTSLFCRVIQDPLDLVQLSVGDNQIGMRTRNAEVFARLLDGEFPRYQAVVPQETEHRLEADAETLARKIRLVANVTGDEARAIKLKMAGSDASLFGQSAGRGAAHAHMEVEYSGDPAEIAFNPDYVVEGLKNCEGPTVVLEFNERTSPGKFRLGENYLYVVMPITLDT